MHCLPSPLRAPPGVPTPSALPLLTLLCLIQAFPYSPRRASQPRSAPDVPTPPEPSLATPLRLEASQPPLATPLCPRRPYTPAPPLASPHTFQHSQHLPSRPRSAPGVSTPPASLPPPGARAAPGASEPETRAPARPIDLFHCARGQRVGAAHGRDAARINRAVFGRGSSGRVSSVPGRTALRGSQRAVGPESRTRCSDPPRAGLASSRRTDYCQRARVRGLRQRPDLHEPRVLHVSEPAAFPGPTLDPEFGARAGS